jgi:hypothetical protein
MDENKKEAVPVEFQQGFPVTSQSMYVGNSPYQAAQ